MGNIHKRIIEQFNINDLDFDDDNMQPYDSNIFDKQIFDPNVIYKKILDDYGRDVEDAEIEFMH